MSATVSICVIDGNIGAGKSTILSELCSIGYRTYPEPIADWKRYLELFYADPKRWSFTVQIAILMSLEKQKLQIDADNRNTNNTNNLVFVERSPESSMIFAAVQKELGYLTDVEFDIVADLYARIKYTAAYTFLINVSSQTCLTRIRSRDRSYEKKIDLEYLTKLNEKYRHIDAIDIDGSLPISDIVTDMLQRVA